MNFSLSDRGSSRTWTGAQRKNFYLLIGQGQIKCFY